MRSKKKKNRWAIDRGIRYRNRLDFEEKRQPYQEVLISQGD